MRHLAHEHVHLLVVTLVVGDVADGADHNPGLIGPLRAHGDPARLGGVQPAHPVFELAAIVHGVVGGRHEARYPRLIALGEQCQEARQRDNGRIRASDHRLDRSVAFHCRGLVVERPKARLRRLECKRKAFFELHV